MSDGDVFTFLDPSTELAWKTGQLEDPGATEGDVLTVQADGSIAAAPGGGSQPAKMQTFSGTTSVGAGSNAKVGWLNPVGDDLLDLTDPTQPVVKADGAYIIGTSVVFFDTPPVAPTPMTAELVLDDGGADVGIQVTADESTTPSVALGSPYKFTAGQIVDMVVSNGDVAPRSFLLVAVVMKIG